MSVPGEDALFAQIKQLRQERGATLVQIAAELGHSLQELQTVLRHRGLKITDLGLVVGYNVPSKYPDRGALVEQAVELRRDELLTMAEIAAALSCPSIGMFMTEAGIRLNAIGPCRRDRDLADALNGTSAQPAAPKPQPKPAKRQPEPTKPQPGPAPAAVAPPPTLVVGRIRAQLIAALRTRFNAEHAVAVAMNLHRRALQLYEAGWSTDQIHARLVVDVPFVAGDELDLMIRETSHG